MKLKPREIKYIRNKIVWIIASVFCNICVCNGRPVVSPGISVPAPEIMKFMKRFGYLDFSSSDSEALYHETAIKDAIKNIQKFGALNQTGILNNETLQLLVSPRCGVPDMDSRNHRQKRYVVGSKAWQKRKIKYFIANWSSKVGEEKVADGMKKAFKVWSHYTNLKFKRVYDTSADIIVAFGTSYHGDNYPFDGPGNILAHAYYPYEMDSYGGDIHFDEDENWKENSTHLGDGVDFYTVAVHEMGHSLGLAHSPVYSSIMFPYYKGPGHTNLDFDDILAMYELYTPVEDTNDEQSDEADNEENTDSEVTTELSTTEMSVSITPSQDDDRYSTFEGDFETVDSHRRKFSSITTAQPRSRRPFSTTLRSMRPTRISNTIPDICEGYFDSVSVFRGDIYIFKGKYIWRLTDEYRIMRGYPIKLWDMFSFLPRTIEKITASYERPTDNALVLFSGKQFWIYDGFTPIEDTPKPLSSIGIDQSVDEIDAAMFWPKNQRTYLFAEGQFWRYGEYLQIPEPDYPKGMHRWKGLPQTIDAAATIGNATYFFKGNLYWLYNNKWIRPERGFPRRASTAWLGCPLVHSQRMRQFRFSTRF